MIAAQSASDASTRTAKPVSRWTRRELSPTWVLSFVAR